MRVLILGSTSRYRADLLRRFGIAFNQRAPEVDERVGLGPVAVLVRVVVPVLAPALGISETEVVVLPSPALVGVIAVTSISFPSGLDASAASGCRQG